MLRRSFGLLALSVFCLVGNRCGAQEGGQQVADAQVKDVEVVIKTSKGDIECTVYASKVPVTAANFLNLAYRKYYNGLTFHRSDPQLHDPRRRSRRHGFRWSRL